MSILIRWVYGLILILFIAHSLVAQKNVCKPCEEKKKKQLLQSSALTRVLIIFDASNSMSGKWQGQEKIKIARRLCFQLIDSLSKIPNLQLALRVYGAGVKYPPGDCQDSKLVIPFNFNNTKDIKDYINKLQPTGITPIEYSLIQSVNDFPDNVSLNNIILITDGIEECKGDPCKAREYLQSQGIIFKPFIIGIGLNSKQSETFNCVGNYYDAQQENLFKDLTQVIEQQKLNKTTLQVNLMDIAGKPSETNVNVCFYDALKNNYLYNYIHSLNELNNPDTITLPSHIKYKVIAYTIPPSESAAITLNSGKHNIVAIDAPQGILNIQREKGTYNFNEKTRIVIRNRSTKEILNVQNINLPEKYIVNTYDVNVLTLPRIDQTIDIYPVKTTSMTIPSAGELKIQSLEAGNGSIFLVKPDGKLEWVANLTSDTQQTFYLLPFKYLIVWRAKSMRSSIYTIQKEVEIKPHQSYLIKLY